MNIDLTEWRWFDFVNAADGISITTTGTTDWVVSSREGGFILDRLVLVHEDNNATIDDAYLDGLSNTPIPEPGVLGLFTGFVALGCVMVRRRRRG